MKKWVLAVLVLALMVFLTGCVEQSSNDSGGHKGVSGKDLEEYNRLAREAFTNGSDVYIK